MSTAAYMNRQEWFCTVAGSWAFPSMGIFRDENFGRCKKQHTWHADSRGYELHAEVVRTSMPGLRVYVSLLLARRTSCPTSLPSYVTTSAWVCCWTIFSCH